jgi:hypothetical protein
MIRNYKQINYVLIFLYNFIGPTLLFIFIQESYTIKVVIFTYMLFCLMTYCLSLKFFLSLNSNNDTNWCFVLRCNQFFSSIYSIVSLVILYGNPGADISEYDKNLNTCLFFFIIFQIILNETYIRKYNNDNQIQPLEAPTQQIVINISRIHPENELKLFINNLKGKIQNDFIEECSVCLEITKIDEKIEEKKDEIVVLNCSHKYHYKCLNNCFINGIKRCPNCRTDYI